MIVCPVCEHAQPEGAECDVCGKKLLHGAAAIPLVPPVDGLEPTRHAGVDAGAERLPDLEPTRHGPADPPADPAPDLDRGRAAPVDIAVDAAPDIERTDAAIPGDARTAVPAIVTCRYCRTPATQSERVCSRCGMRLPVFERAGGDVATPPRRCSCGAIVTGPLCAICGARVA